MALRLERDVEHECGEDGCDGWGTPPPYTPAPPNKSPADNDSSKKVVSPVKFPDESGSGQQGRPKIPVDPTQQRISGNPPLSPVQRLLYIEAGLFLVAAGMAIAMLGIVIIAAAGTELVGGATTGPFELLVAGHALPALAWGSIMTGGGVCISAFGAYLIYSGITGKKPWKSND